MNDETTLTTAKTDTWYIIKQADGHCQIWSAQQLDSEESTEIQKRWGPYSSKPEAIARRVGLIRSGQCQPI